MQLTTTTLPDENKPCRVFHLKRDDNADYMVMFDIEGELPNHDEIMNSVNNMMEELYKRQVPAMKGYIPYGVSNRYFMVTQHAFLLSDSTEFVDHCWSKRMADKDGTMEYSATCSHLPGLPN